MAIEKIINIKVQADQAVKEVEELNQELEQTNDSQDTIAKSAFENAKAFKIMGVSINDVSKALKLLKVSLIATGIGAIVVAVGALAAAFLSTQEGIDKLNSVLVPLKAVFDGLLGIAQKLSKGLFKIVSGDITEGWNEMADAVSNLGDQMSEAWKKGKQLYDLQILIRNLEIDNITAITDLTLQRDKALEIAENVKVAAEERKKQYQLAIDSENTIALIRQNTLKAKIKELEISQSISDTSSDEYKELIRLQNDLKVAESDRIRSTTLLMKRMNAVRGEKKQDPRDAVSPITGVSTNELELITAEQTSIVAIGYEEMLRGQARMQEGMTERQRQESLKRQEIDRIEREHAINAAQNLLFSIEQMSGKGTALAKAAGIANVLIDTFRALQGTWAGYAKFGPWGTAAAIAQTAAITVSGAAAVRNIMAVSEKNAATSGTATGITQPPQPQFNVVEANNNNQLAETIAGFEAKPVKSYVVSSEVTTQQALDRRIVANAAI